jgi:hypothetical protein
MSFWNVIIGLGWVPLVVGHALWAWHAEGALTTYWMLCVCALSVGYVVQWIIAQRAIESKVSQR